MRRFAFVFALLLTVVPATSAAQAHRQGIERCQTGGYSPGVRPAHARDLKLRVAVHLEQEPGQSPRALWTLRLRNRTGRAIQVMFPSSKYADVVLRRRGRVAYVWSRGLGFTDAITYRTLSPHGTYACTLGPSELNVEGLEQGRYEQIAFLDILERERPARVESRGWFSIH